MLHEKGKAVMGGQRGGTVKDKPIPEPTEKLIEMCNADDQFSNLDQTLRLVLSSANKPEAVPPPKKSKR
jgi:hypothetical protein